MSRILLMLSIAFWITLADPPGTSGHGLLHRLPHAAKLDNPWVLSALLCTLFNGWCTAQHVQSCGVLDVPGVPRKLVGFRESDAYDNDNDNDKGRRFDRPGQ